MDKMDKGERAFLVTYLICIVEAKLLTPKIAYEVGKFYGCVP